jgi:hypothetical protein
VPDLSAAERIFAVRHAHPASHTKSEDGTPLKRPAPEPLQSWPSLDDASQRMHFALRVPCLNAIIAVASFFDMHRLSNSRTPEVQFLMRLRDAAVHADTFHLAHGEYRPHAAYGGIVIDEHVDGHALIGNDAEAGLVTPGDVIGLLRYLRTLLRSMQSVISSGDAG